MESPIEEMTAEEVVKDLKKRLKSHSKSELVRIAIKLIIDKLTLQNELKAKDNG